MVGQWAGKGMGGCYNKGKKEITGSFTYGNLDCIDYLMQIQVQY